MVETVTAATVIPSTDLADPLGLLRDNWLESSWAIANGGVIHA